ncbi:hypothetical protein DPMN_069796 [Dreissena polymorpha]|uniref:Uncharacterized protein n=1 Tax=Dreissena polymorpha TaxID=45954 RepID=A0A9D3Z3Z0_DREPO|nr:hypothetical protein DPMN_069796 [Dreissena polymorpha]
MLFAAHQYGRYKRKKSQKKAQRRKDLEEERETEKNKWIDFNSKNKWLDFNFKNKWLDFNSKVLGWTKYPRACEYGVNLVDKGGKNKWLDFNSKVLGWTKYPRACQYGVNYSLANKMLDFNSKYSLVNKWLDFNSKVWGLTEYPWACGYGVNYSLENKWLDFNSKVLGGSGCDVHLAAHGTVSLWPSRYGVFLATGLIHTVVVRKISPKDTKYWFNSGNELRARSEWAHVDTFTHQDKWRK